MSTPRNFFAAAANASSSVSGSFSTSFGAFGSGAASSPVSQMSSIFLAILYLLPVPSKTCVESSSVLQLGVSRGLREVLLAPVGRGDPSEIVSEFGPLR